MKQLRVLIITCVLTFFVTATVSAQGSLELSTSPSVGYLKVQPGGQATHTIVIENSGDQTLSVTPRVVDFTSDGKTGTPVLSQTHSFPYFDASSQNLETVIIRPKTKAQLSLQIQVPQNAPNREYPLTVLFEAKPLEEFSVSGTTAQIQSFVGSNLVILVTDESAPEVSLRVASLQRRKLADSFRPLRFSPLVENTGYAASIASGSAELKNWRGNVIKKFPIKPVVVLGSSTRELEVDSSDATSATVFIHSSFFHFGVYSFTVNLEYKKDDQTMLITYSEKVFAFPFLLIALITISISSYLIHIRIKKPY